MLNYKASLIELVDTDGQTHILSAFKIKHLSGDNTSSMVFVELEGFTKVIRTRQPVTDLRDEWYSKLDEAVTVAHS